MRSGTNVRDVNEHDERKRILTKNTADHDDERGVVEALDRVADAVLTAALVDAVTSGKGQLILLVLDALRGDQVGVGRALKELDAEWLRFD